MKKAILKYFETSENGNITYQNLWYTARVVLRGKFRAIDSVFKKAKRRAGVVVQQIEPPLRTPTSHAGGPALSLSYFELLSRLPAHVPGSQQMMA